MLPTLEVKLSSKSSAEEEEQEERLGVGDIASINIARVLALIFQFFNSFHPHESIRCDDYVGNQAKEVRQGNINNRNQ